MASFVLWFQRLLEAPKFDLRIKVGQVLKIQVILCLMGTEIIHFGPRQAEKTRFEVAYPTLKNHYQNLL